MINFCVQDIFKEELKERDLNAIDLLQIYATEQEDELIIEYEIDDGLITLMETHNIDVVLEILAAIQKDVEMHGEGFEVKIVKKEQNETDNRLER